MNKIQSFLLEYKYVPEKYEKHIKEFKYRGSDQSLLYQYVFSPFAEFCLRFTPQWIAPNTLTVISFLMILIPHLIYLFLYGNDFKIDAPVWLIVFTLVLYLLYMNLDNMDGKQARRTGNSSPLGMLLDHQMDSMVIVCEAINVSSIIKCGVNIYAYNFLSVPGQLFYFNTLEAYYTGQMDLGIINGASEGTISVALVFLLTALFGPEWWAAPIPFGFQISKLQFLQSFFCLLSIPITIPIIQNIVKHNKNNLFPALKAWLFGLFILYSSAYHILFSSVAETHTRQIFYLSAMSFSTQCGIIQAYHVAEVPLNTTRLTPILVNGIPLLNAIIFNLTGNEIISEGPLINVCTTIAFLLQVHFLINICRQFKRVLGINIFSIENKMMKNKQ